MLFITAAIYLGFGTDPVVGSVSLALSVLAWVGAMESWESARKRFRLLRRKRSVVTARDVVYKDED